MAQDDNEETRLRTSSPPAARRVHASSSSSRSWFIRTSLLCLILVIVAAVLAIVIHIDVDVPNSLGLTSGSETGGETPPASTASTPPAALLSGCKWCDEMVQRVTDSETSVVTENCIHLKQEDFARGTFIMRTNDACYILDEDIVFRPAEDNDFRATREPYASNMAFVADFFAAILIQASGVTVNLNGHEIRQSRAHALQQRFYAHIELTTPFIPDQGPASFANASNPPTEAKRVKIHNGRLGLSSHHGIHGNGMWSVCLEDLDIIDYEVAAIALNAATDVIIRRVRAQGTLMNVPVNGAYSASRFLLPFVDRAVHASVPATVVGANQARIALVAAAERLKRLMQQTFVDVTTRTSGQIDKEAHPEAYDLFGNPSLHPDGGAVYGILVNAHGVAVDRFQCDNDAEANDHMHHVLITDCEVHRTHLHPLEFVALKDVVGNKLQRGPVGDLFDTWRCVNRTTGAYRPNALADTVIALQKITHVASLPPRHFGTLAIHPDVVVWAESGGSLAAAVEAGTLDYIRGTDQMFHVSKGAVGISVGGGSHIAIRRTIVRGVTNTGPGPNMVPLPGETEERAYWTGSHDGGHPGASPAPGYGGNDAYGIAVAATRDVVLDKVHVRDIESRAGWASGIAVFNDASATELVGVAIADIKAVLQPQETQVSGAKQPRAVGLLVTTDAESPVIIGPIDISDVRTGHIGTAANTLYENTGIEGCTVNQVNFYTV